MRLITGHDLVQPKPADAPLEFTFDVGDAELLAKCDAAIGDLRQKNAIEATEEAARDALGGAA